MGVSFRKSMKAGPLRFNLSKSGIGVSAGVKGLRVGTGPRGGYVSAGRGGVYYRKSLGSSRWQVQGSSAAEPIDLPVADLVGDDLEGADVIELVDALPSELIDRIQEAANLRKPSFFRNPFTYRRRKLEWLADKAVPLFYEVDDAFLAVYDELATLASDLGSSSGRYYDRHSLGLDEQTGNKGHGGAGAVVDRIALAVRLASPPDVTLNFEPPEFVAPERSLFLLPDQALVRQGKQYAAIPLRSLEIRVHRSQFITRTVPAGVSPIGYTWTYVNKSGGPDRRFKDNPQIPIIEICEIDFHGPAGFQFHSAFTSMDAATRFGETLDRLRELQPQRAAD